MSPLLTVATIASTAAISGGVSKLFGISTPKAAAMYSIGYAVLQLPFYKMLLGHRKELFMVLLQYVHLILQEKLLPSMFAMSM